jgi:hypothetical protein
MFEYEYDLEILYQTCDQRGSVMTANLTVRHQKSRPTNIPMFIGMSEARARFEERFRELQDRARGYFRDYEPEARDEAVANSLFLTWHYLVSLVKQGKANDALMTSTLQFACRQTRSGRMMRTVRASKSRELWDHVRKGGHAILTGVDLNAFVSNRNAVLDIVAFRVDTKDWLDSLSEKQRKRALELAEGHSTGELAKRWKVTAPAVSLYRRQLNESYDRFVNR